MSDNENENQTEEFYDDFTDEDDQFFAQLFNVLANNNNNELFEEQCGYFENLKSEITLNFWPEPDEIIEMYNLDNSLSDDDANKLFYEKKLDCGFRRSGTGVYKNVCPKCRKCCPVRVPAQSFKMSKSQRHNWRKNQDITVKIVTDIEEMLTPEKVRLYAEYQSKHNEGNIMSEHNALFELKNWNGYQDDFFADNKKFYPGTVNFDYYLGDRLVGVSILDFTLHNVSSAYFYYDVSPEILKRSLGTFSVLKEIEYCALNDIKYYDLGYYIKDCNKMNYKTNFKPYEILVDDEWIESEVYEKNACDQAD